MRLSEFASAPKAPAAATEKVLATVTPLLVALGAGEDPEGWLAWGDDPAIRWLFLTPTPGGLVQVHVRVNVPGEGPHSSAKVTRWSRVQVGEMAIETATSGHRVASFQLENQVIRGGDADADAIAAFALAVFAAIDGRPSSAPGAPGAPAG